MKHPEKIVNKIMTLEQLRDKAKEWRASGQTIAFTNGCFDILHAGHLASLSAAAAEADRLIVAVNADESVKKLKGSDRPVNKEESRALLIAAIELVDGVVVFAEDTPIEVIRSILPDVLVKGGDYKVSDIAGSKEVIEAGGRVVINPIVHGFSTTAIIEKMKKAGS